MAPQSLTILVGAFQRILSIIGVRQKRDKNPK
jgi:hypothetical protein